MTEVSETGPIAGSREGRHPGAAGAAVEIDAKLRTPTAQRAQVWRQNPIEIGIAFKYGPEAIFHNDGQPQVGTRALEDVESGRGEDAIPQRPKPEDGHPAALRQAIQNAFHGCLFFDFRLVDQHHGDIVANGVDTMALHTFQTTLVGFEVDHGLADGADEDLQELFADSHSESLV